MIKISTQHVLFRNKASMIDDKLTVKGGRYIQVDISSVTLGIDGVRLFVEAYPIDMHGNIVPILKNPNSRGLEIGGHTFFGVVSRVTLDGGELGKLYKGYLWEIVKPPQAAVNDNSAGFFINVHYDRID